MLMSWLMVWITVFGLAAFAIIPMLTLIKRPRSLRFRQQLMTVVICIPLATLLMAMLPNHAKAVEGAMSFGSWYTYLMMGLASIVYVAGFVILVLCLLRSRENKRFAAHRL